MTVRPIIDSAGARQAARGLSRAGGAGGAGGAEPRGRAEFPHARGLRRRDRRRAGAARAAADRRRARAARAARRRPHARRARTPCAARAARHRARARGRARCRHHAGAALPFPIRSRSRSLSAEIAHKSDVGGVVLGVADGAALLARDRNNPRRCRRTNARSARRTRAGAADGRPASARFWSAIASTATSGRWSWWRPAACSPRSMRDRSLRLAPVDLATAHEMIAEVRGLIALTGYPRQAQGRSRRARARHRRAVAAGAMMPTVVGGRDQSADRAARGRGRRRRRCRWLRLMMERV